MDLCGKSVLIRIVDRLRECKSVDKIIVATTYKDNEIIKECMENEVYYYQGPEDDVLGRYYHCADYYGTKKNDGIVRITADCPLIDPKVVGELIELWKKNKDKYISNVMPPDENGKRVSTYPDGFDCEMFSFSLLKEAWENAKTEYDMEHVCPWMFKNKECAIMKYKEDYGGMKLTLDTQEDYNRIFDIYNKMTSQSKFLNDQIPYLEDILEYTGVKNESKII